MRIARVGIIFAVLAGVATNAAAQTFTENNVIAIDYNSTTRNITAGGDINNAPVISYMSYGAGGWGSSIVFDATGTYGYAVSADSNWKAPQLSCHLADVVG